MCRKKSKPGSIKWLQRTNPVVCQAALRCTCVESGKAPEPECGSSEKAPELGRAGFASDVFLLHISTASNTTAIMPPPPQMHGAEEQSIFSKRASFSSSFSPLSSSAPRQSIPTRVPA